MSFEFQFFNNKKRTNDDKISETKEKKIVSEEWLFVDKRDNIEVCSCSSTVVKLSNKIDEELHVSNVLSKLRPFIPLSIEEASLTTNLENWSNCNVRLSGVLKYNGDKRNYYLESVNETSGIYKIMLDFKNSERIPLLNETIQVFGEIKTQFYSGKVNIVSPFVSVSFFRNMETGNFLQYMEAVEEMKSFIPLFLKTSNYSSQENYENDDFVSDFNIVE